MTLENTLRRQLSNPEPGGFHVSSGDWHVTVAAEKSDSLSCALRELTLERNAPIQEELPAWAARVAARVTGLIEPLKVVEVDQPLGKALLRSAAPTVKDGKAFYYELLLERTSHTAANLKRFAGDRNGSEKREAVVFVLTHDAIVKLVADIAGAN
jgi:hypothetical protein